jgi:3-oxoacyl-[acyl-carrier protein] reductase
MADLCTPIPANVRVQGEARPLDGRVAVVTGGSSGIGRASAAALADAGAEVAIVGRDPARVRDAVREMRGNGSQPRLGMALDVRSEADMDELASTVLDRLGRIDILVCCAGIDARPDTASAIPYPVAAMSEAAWRDVIDTNVRGVFLALRAALPVMIAQRRGDVVIVGSAHAGLQGQPLAAAYSASKFAVGAIAESVAEEARRQGIRVQVVAPGLVDTPLAAAPALHAEFGPPLAPERVGGLIAHLVALPDDVTVGASRGEGVAVVRHVDAGRPRRGGGPGGGRGETRRRRDPAPFVVEGSVAIITGAASGIGRATAHTLAQAGAMVVVVDRSRDALHEVASALARQGHEPMSVAADVRRADEVAQMVDRVVQRFGRVDTLIASAGILRSAGGAPRPLASMTVAEWTEVIDVNLTGTFLCNRAVLRPMVAQRHGQIINIASLSGRIGRALDSAYSASKAGVIGLTESLRAEVASRGVRVAALVPDVVDTPLWRQNGPIPRPKEILPVERVAETLLTLLSLPGDLALVDPVLAPFRGRRAPWSVHA